MLSNVHIGELRSKGSVLVNVSAKKAECNGSMLYNVFDDSEEGVRAGPGAVRADVILPDGKKLSMLTELTRHSGNDWKVKLDGNELSFEEVYKLNLSANTTAVLQQMEAAHTAVAATRGTTA